MNRPLIGVTCHIAPKCVTAIPQYEKKGDSGRGMQLSSLLNLERKKKSGALSKASRKRLMNAINWMVYSTPWKSVYSKKYNRRYKWKINLFTLTMPADSHITTEKEFNAQLLNPFLTNFRKNYGLKNYIWKIEPTQKGVLHCHLTTDTYLHYEDLNRMWNKCLRRAGLTHAFYLEHGHHNLPSAKVHSVKKVRNLAGYLAKYLSKAAQSMKVAQGRNWGCNQELSRVQGVKVDIDPQDAPSIFRAIQESTIASKEIYTKPDSQGRNFYIGTCYFPTPRDWIRQTLGPIKEAFDNAVFYLRSQYEQTPLLAYAT